MSRLGGLAVYDTGFNITWLANANLYGSTQHWDQATAWVANLNIGGFTGWRLPNADPACGTIYNCINSELGHLYYTELGVTQGNPITSSTSPYLALFTNVQSANYWSGTTYATDITNAWAFSSGDGEQFNWYKGNINLFIAWAVRSGDVGGSSVPEPGIIGLMGIGALAWAGTRQKRRGLSG